jgi:hypothetical protein
MLVCADRRDWVGLRAALADKVRLDWTSLNGGEPVTLSGDQVVAAWTQVLGGFQATQHLLGNLLVPEQTDERAHVTAYGQATNVLPDAHGDSRPRGRRVAGRVPARPGRPRGRRLTAPGPAARPLRSPRARARASRRGRAPPPGG